MLDTTAISVSSRY